MGDPRGHVSLDCCVQPEGLQLSTAGWLALLLHWPLHLPKIGGGLLFGMDRETDKWTYMYIQL